MATHRPASNTVHCVGGSIIYPLTNPPAPCLWTHEVESLFSILFSFFFLHPIHIAISLMEKKEMMKWKFKDRPNGELPLPAFLAFYFLFAAGKEKHQSPCQSHLQSLPIPGRLSVCVCGGHRVRKAQKRTLAQCNGTTMVLHYHENSINIAMNRLQMEIELVTGRGWEWWTICSNWIVSFHSAFVLSGKIKASNNLYFSPLIVHSQKESQTPVPFESCFKM